MKQLQELVMLVVLIGLWVAMMRWVISGTRAQGVARVVILMLVSSFIGFLLK